MLPQKYRPEVQKGCLFEGFKFFFSGSHTQVCLWDFCRLKASYTYSLLAWIGFLRSFGKQNSGEGNGMERNGTFTWAGPLQATFFRPRINSSNASMTTPLTVLPLLAAKIRTLSASRRGMATVNSWVLSGLSGLVSSLGTGWLPFICLKIKRFLAWSVSKSLNIQK